MRIDKICSGIAEQVVRKLENREELLLFAYPTAVHTKAGAPRIRSRQTMCMRIAPVDS